MGWWQHPLLILVAIPVGLFLVIAALVWTFTKPTLPIRGAPPIHAENGGADPADEPDNAQPDRGAPDNSPLAENHPNHSSAEPTTDEDR